MDLIHPREALDIVLAAAKAMRPVALSLDQALGHCLARDVHADRDLPPADRSAMDGYAIVSADISDALPVTLRLTGESAAGAACQQIVRLGTCVRILTGGVIPEGADTVIELERTREVSPERIELLSPVKPGANIRCQAEDARRGSIILRQGTLLGGSQIGLCAAVGRTEVHVHDKPAVTIISTGSELRPVDEKLASHQIRDSNGPAISAVLTTAGFNVRLQASVPDAPGDLDSVIGEALPTADVIILSGGVSVGRYDFVPAAIANLRARVRFHGVLMKPGKPVLYATLGRKHLLGLPGNPVSALHALHLFGLPLLRRLAGYADPWCRPTLSMQLVEGVELRGRRVEYRLAQVESRADGQCVRLLESTGSGDQVRAAMADGVVEFDPSKGPWPAGTTVSFIPWRPLW